MQALSQQVAPSTEKSQGKENARAFAGLCWAGGPLESASACGWPCTDPASVLPAGRLVRLPVLEAEPVADDSHVPLPHGADLPHVVGVLLALGRAAPQPLPAAPGALPRRTEPPHTRHQSLLDPQEDAAAAPSGGLELRAAGAQKQPARRGQRPGAAEEGAVAAGARTAARSGSCLGSAGVPCTGSRRHGLRV